MLENKIANLCSMADTSARVAPALGAKTPPGLPEMIPSAVAKKYGGGARFETKDGVFQASVYLPLRGSKIKILN